MEGFGTTANPSKDMISKQPRGKVDTGEQESWLLLQLTLSVQIKRPEARMPGSNEPS